MSNERRDLIRSVLTELQDVSIENEAVQRIVESTATHEHTFKPLEIQSFFDTEPSQFDVTLSEQKKSR